MLLSLVSFDQNDPSINHAVSNPAVVKNNAGLFGAYLSGLLVDIFGFAALVWPAVFIAWGAGCISTWFTMPWWRWCGFTLLAACLISLGAAWDLGLGDVRGGGMLGMTLYTRFTTLFSPVGSTLIWLFLLFLSLELAFGIAWLSLIRRAWLLLKEQLSGTPLSLDNLPERLSKLPRMGRSAKETPPAEESEPAQPESAADVIALFDL
ncbi:DNA translocase FtsK 4TM domain-containing protein, partial [uncultured Bilophila sp.]